MSYLFPLPKSFMLTADTRRLMQDWGTCQFIRELKKRLRYPSDFLYYRSFLMVGQLTKCYRLAKASLKKWKQTAANQKLLSLRMC